MRENYGPGVIPLSIPIMEDGKMTGIVDVMNRRAFSIYEKSGAMTEMPVPAAFESRIDELQNAVNEVVAESDEELIEKYFAG